jgi:hypothetical protein
VDKGRYKGRRVDFTPYAVSLFTPHLYFKHEQAGCGATALALLTGVPSLMVRAANKGKPHYSDSFMISFLRKRKFRIRKLTLCDVSHAVKPVGFNYVLLLSQLVAKNECTWVVIYRGVCWHNCDTYFLDAQGLLNKPAISAYLVWHPRWGRGGTDAIDRDERSKCRWFALVIKGKVLQKTFTASIEDAEKRFRILWGKLPLGSKVVPSTGRRM